MAFPTTPILDDFNRPNEGPPPSADWSDFPGTDGMVVDGNEAIPDGASGGGYWNTITNANCEVYATLVNIDDGEGMILFARSNDIAPPLDPGAIGYWLIIARDDVGGDGVILFSGISGPLDLATLDLNIGDKFGLECNGNTITGYHCPVGGTWIQVVSAVDSTTLGPGYIGAVLGTDVHIDDFGGGDYNAPPIPIGTPSMSIPRLWHPVITTMSPLTGRQYRLSDDRNRQWFSHYGAEGAGFGYLTWRCKRRVGYDYPDLGYGFPVTMRKGPFNCLFDGQIVRITERTGTAGDEIEVWALGWVHVATADVYNRVWSDTRLNKWLGDETPSGSFRPDCFDWDVNDRIYFKPRRGVDFVTGDYSRLRYTFEFGEHAARLVADYDVALPNHWPGEFSVLDGNGVTLWSLATGGAGTLDLLTTGDPDSFEVRFALTSSGENTAADDTVYGQLTSAVVYSEHVTVLDAKVIADDLASILSDDAHGLSDSTDRIEPPGTLLTPAAFDRDQTPAQILSWCCQFGDADGNPVVWGVALDTTRRLFLEPMRLTTVKYVVKPRQMQQLERGGDWGESAQVAYGIYTDVQGQVLRTADRSLPDVIARLGGYYRRTAVQISGTTDVEQVEGAIDLWLAEHGRPGTAGSFQVRSGVYTPTGRFVPVDELRPGDLVQVREWRAREATLSEDDWRDSVTTFPLAGVKVDEDARTAELIPRMTSDAFARQIAIIQGLQST